MMFFDRGKIGVKTLIVRGNSSKVVAGSLIVEGKK